MKAISQLITILIILVGVASQPAQQPVIGIYTQDAEDFS